MKSPVSQAVLKAQTKIRIVIADDHAVVRFGIKSMLSHEAGFLVVGEAENGETAISQTVELQPDILLLDLQMPRSSGLNAVLSIVRQSPRVRIILLAGAITPSQSLEALQTGARGIVEKTTMVEDLTLAIRTVQVGNYWFDGKQFSNLLEAQKVLAGKFEAPKRRMYGLTPRELTMIQCIGEGCSNRDISKQLVISEETVKRHLSNIFDKTGVSTRLELALFGITRDLIVVEAA